MSERGKALEAALLRWQSYGCPDCSGDCGSANPPVFCCIMQETRAALAMPATDRAGREADVAHAARVILTALHRAQIDMTILRKFLNGKPNAALTALANLTPPEDAP